MDPWGLETCNMSAANKKAKGAAPTNMQNPHMHHIVREAAPSTWKAVNRQHILDSQAIMSKHGIDINTDPRNFTWAQNGGGAHTAKAAKHVADILKEADKLGLPGVEAALRTLGTNMRAGSFF